MKFLATTSLSLLLFSAAVAAPPPLPEKALGDDVVGVLWIDAKQVDTTQLRQAVSACFGIFANEVNEGLAQWQAHHAALVRAGCTSMAVIQFDPNSINSVTRGVANPVFLFSANKLDAPAVEALVVDIMRDERRQPQAKTEMLDDWIMAYDLRLAAPYMGKSEGNRGKQFVTALKPIANHPAVLAFVPSERMKRRYRAIDEELGERSGIPAATREFTRLLLDCNYLSAAATLGPRPAIELTVEMPSGAEADALLRLVKPVVATYEPAIEKGNVTEVPIEIIQERYNYHSLLAFARFEAKGSVITARYESDVLARTAIGLATGVLKAREEAKFVRSANQMTALVTALNAYAAEHQGVYPRSLDELRVNKSVNNLDELLQNVRTGEKVGYIYVKPPSTYQQMVRDKVTATTPMLYEKKNGRIDPDGIIGYVNTAVVRPDTKRSSERRP